VTAGAKVIGGGIERAGRLVQGDVIGHCWLPSEEHRW
jgi:hypothetical protein